MKAFRLSGFGSARDGARQNFVPLATSLMLESSPLEPLSKEGYGSSLLSTELDELLSGQPPRQIVNRVAIAGAVVFLALSLSSRPSCLALDEEGPSQLPSSSPQAAVGIGFNEAVLNIEKAGSVSSS